MQKLTYTFESMPLLTFFILLLAPLLLIALVTLMIANEIRLKRNKVSGYKGKVKFDKQYWRLFSVSMLVATLSVIAIPVTANILDLKVTETVALDVSPLDSTQSAEYKNAYELIRNETTLVCTKDLRCVTFPKGADPEKVVGQFSKGQNIKIVAETHE